MKTPDYSMISFLDIVRPEITAVPMFDEIEYWSEVGERTAQAETNKDKSNESN